MNQVATIYPSRITITHTRKKKDVWNRIIDKYQVQDCDNYRLTYLDNFKKQKNRFELSKASKKKIMDSINGMFVLSKARTIKMKTGVNIYNYQMSFITLTLPSIQVNSDLEIKDKLLHHFLVEIKKHYGIDNYVWKAELQMNKNIHFHLIVDKYIDFQAIRRRWNRICNKFGYVDAYSEKMGKLTLPQYHKMRNKYSVCQFEKSKKAFAMGKKCNWTNPNSVDVRNVRGQKDLAVYLAKYITKEVIKTELDTELLEREIKFGRSWGRSYSLSRLEYKNKFELVDLKDIIDYFDLETKKVKKIVGDWFKVYYFNINQLHKECKRILLFYLKKNAEIYNYPFPAT